MALSLKYQILTGHKCNRSKTKSKYLPYQQYCDIKNLHIRWLTKHYDTRGLVGYLSCSSISADMTQPSSFIPVTPVHTILTNTDSLSTPINGCVDPLNANDSPLILIRETHQIQTTSQIIRQVDG